jgi:ethanolamine-phosphate cytidylyltransferase
MHGDDPAFNSDGVDICQEMNKVGKFRVFKRTSGVSTTSITAKLLRLLDSEEERSKRQKEIPKQQFLQTSSKIAYFSNQREPKPTDVIVYTAGSLDLMHPGWVDRLKTAKEQGDFLYVGIWDDEMTRYYRGEDYPI